MKNKDFPQLSFNTPQLIVKYRKNKIVKCIHKVLESGIFLNGRENLKLEKNILKIFPEGYITTVASGHDALYLAIKSLNLKKDDEILFPVNAYPTAFAVYLTNTKPVAVDVDINGQIDANEIKKKINKNTKVLIVVHLYGLVGNLDKIINICKKKKIYVIEDCAQAFGSKYKGKFVGSFGDIACFSFYPTKNLPTLGDGGAIYTRKKDLYDYFKKAKSYGEETRYSSNFVSFHSRLPEIQAAILNCLIKNIDKNFKKKRSLHIYFKKTLSKNYLLEKLRILESNPNSDPVPHLLVIEAKNRDYLQKYLRRNNVQAMIHYPYPVHQVKAFSKFNLSKKRFPVAERLSKNILSIPFHEYLSKKEIKYIINLIKQFYSKYA